jgi:ATP-dependent Clp protease ATP-binding subunit ClpA
MDNGFLTDSNGRKVDFRNVIIIMTTNAGAADAAKSEIGFGRGMKDDEQEAAIKRRFTPEFRNRLDATVMFAPLSKEHIGRVVDKFIIQLEAQLADRKIEFEVTKGANQWIADKGYDKRYGARPLGRTIQEYVKKPLADEILFGKLKYGGLVKVGIDRKKENLTFKFIPTPKPKAPEDDTSEASPKEDA